MGLSREILIQSFQEIQDQISTGLLQHTQEAYQEDLWDYVEKGGGRSRVWENNAFLEKGAVNFSAIEGTQLPLAATSSFAPLLLPTDQAFFATGVSLVLHPQNPHIPTIHFNIRYFETPTRFWFGGGIDLTPYYPVLSQVIQFHSHVKSLCDAYELGAYETFKKACDEYFYLKHRQEARGVGGIFFDHLHEEEPERLFNFVKSLGNRFLDIYRPLIEENKGKTFSPAQREFQLYRRGRYVEFNLIYDRGTLFGLQSGGRVESILVSLPAQVLWKYNWKADPGSPEAELTEYFLKAQDWIALKT
jgi:coproporphyrinogen III oxidase